MSDHWVYQVFGQEFGPISTEELQQLAATGLVQADSLIRREGANHWIQASQVSQLGLHSRGDQKSTRSDSDIAATRGADEWFYRTRDVERGPVSFDDLLDLAKTEQLVAEDDVKLGSQGKWRRAGSIGRIVSVLPFRDVEQTLTPRKPAPNPPDRRSSAKVIRQDAVAPVIRQKESPVPSESIDPQRAYDAAYNQARQSIAASILAQGEAAFKLAESQALNEVAWTNASNVDRYWWGWMGAIEYGPVEFAQVLALARNGQIKPSDFIRNGQSQPFVPASNVPGLFQAVAILAKATEARTLAEAQAHAAAQMSVPAPQPALVVPPVQAMDSQVHQNSMTATDPEQDADSQIFRSAMESLSARNLPNLARLEVAVNRGELFVQGNLESDGERMLALKLLGQVSGVVGVVDKIAVNQKRREVNSDPGRRASAQVRSTKRATAAEPGFISRIKDGISGEYRRQVIAGLIAVGIVGFWFIPRSPSRPVAVYPVKGRVMMNGEPLANAAVVLYRVDKTPTKLPAYLHPHGRAAADGSFSLATFETADGAPEGEFVATVFLSEEMEVDGEKTFGPNQLPSQYAKAETSPFRVKITSSTRELQPLELTRQ